MTNETHHKVSEDNPKRFLKIVLGLAAIYIMTFLSGFLQNTQPNLGSFLLDFFTIFD